jgi:hypothetical protein
MAGFSAASALSVASHKEGVFKAAVVAVAR